MLNINFSKFQLILLILFSINGFLQSQDQTCLSFDGFTDRVTIPLQISQSLDSKDFTFEARINGLEADNTTATILSNRSSLNSGFHLFVHNYWNGSDHQLLAFRYNNTNWMYVNNGDFDGKLLDGDCHHVALSKEGSSITFYIDGIIVGIRENQPDIDISNSVPILIGNDGYSNDAFNGIINDVRIWNIGRSKSEIEEGVYNEIDPNTDGLLGYWKMREGSGQTLTDLTNQNDAVLGGQSGVESNDPTWGNNCCEIPDPSNMCLGFDGSVDYAAIPTEVSQSLGNSDFTFEAQISGLEADNTTATILSNRSSLNSGFHLFIHNYWNGSDHQILAFRYNNTNWMYINNGDFNGKLLDGDCHHVALSKEGSSISFYIDGIIVGIRENQPDIDISNSVPILIGNDGYSNDAFNGTINDVRIWNKARSQSELQDGIDSGVDPNEDGLLGYWEMREGSGQSLADLTNQNDAVLGAGSDEEPTDPTWGNKCCGKGIVLDIKDLEDAIHSLSVYPNPSNGIFSIDLKDNFIANKYDYTLYDNMGRVLENNTLSTQNLDFKHIIPGQYFLQIFNSQEVLGVSKLVIMK